jgi:C2H2 type zinc-finger (1 copy)
MIACPVCRLEVADLSLLADHFWDAADASDVGHVMWLNRHVGLREMPREALREKLERALRP